MAKVTDLNGCFVRVDGDVNIIKTVIDTVEPDVTTGNRSNPRVKDIFFRSGPGFLIADFVKINPASEFKEIYFHEGEFFDAPVVVYDIEPERIQWADGSIDEQESSKIEYEDGMRKAMRSIARTCGKSFAVDIGYEDLPALVEKLMHESKDNSEWSNGDRCLSSNGYSFTFIGMCDKYGFDCILLSDDGVPTFGYTKELSKPETEAEKKRRELAEEVNGICCELFGTPAFDCNQDIIDTVEKFIVNGYKKVD